MNDLAVVLFYQNFTHDEDVFNAFTKCYENLKKQGIVTYVINPWIDEKETAKLPVENKFLWPYQVKGPFWCKENAVAHYVNKNLPKEYSKVVWMDSNVIIEDGKWAEKMSSLLENKKLVHIGENFTYLNQSGDVAMTEGSGAKFFLEKGKDKFSFEEHSLGVGWGANRDFFKEVGPFTFDVSGLGGNEVITFLSLAEELKENKAQFLESIKSKNMELFFRAASYGPKALKYTQGNVGYLKGNVKTLYAGKYSIEKYSDRLSKVKLSLLEKANLSQAINTTWELFNSKTAGGAETKTKECLEFEIEFWKYLNFVLHGEYKHPESIVVPNPPIPKAAPPKTADNTNPNPPPLANPDPRTVPAMKEEKNPEGIPSTVLKRSLESMGTSWKEARREVYEAKLVYERALRKEEMVYNNFIRGLDNL